MTYSTPCITFSPFPSNVFNFILQCSMPSSCLALQGCLKNKARFGYLHGWEERGKKRAFFRFDIRYIRYSSKLQHPQLQQKSLSNSRCPSIHTPPQFGNPKEAVSSWILLIWNLQEILLSVFYWDFENVKTWLTVAISL